MKKYQFRIYTRTCVYIIENTNKRFAYEVFDAGYFEKDDTYIPASSIEKIMRFEL